MRNSWKTVAENLMVALSRDQMVQVLKHHSEKLTNPQEIMSSHERAASSQTVKYMIDCIAEYDWATGDE